MKLRLKGRRAKRIADYYPKNIGLSLPANTFDYEFLICGKNVPYTQNQIVNVFVEHGAMLLALDSSVNESEDKIVLTVCCNLEHAASSPMELAIQLQSMKSVISAEYSEIGGRLFGRRLAGIALNNKHSAVALPSSTLISLGKRLAKEAGSIGTHALYQEGRTYAHSAIRELSQILNLSQKIGYSTASQDQVDDSERTNTQAYCVKCRKTRQILDPKQVILSNKAHALQGICPVCSTKVFKIGARNYGKIRGGPLLENAQAFLMATGWGRFELRTPIEGRFGEVTILDPPTLEGDVSYGNQFVEGIAAGLLEAASGNGNEMTLIGENYDPYGRTLRLHFTEQIPVKIRANLLATSKVERQKLSSEKKQREIKEPVSLPPEEPRVVLPVSEDAVQEVDQIIRSLEKVESEVRTSVGEKQKAPEEESQSIAELVPSENSSGQ